MTWSLPALLEEMHENVAVGLSAAKRRGHATTQGDTSETAWLTAMRNFLPTRYAARRAFIVDSNGRFSDQLDIVVHDQQYSPFILKHEDSEVVPAESVYAVFEVKQDATADNLRYAGRKIASARTLHRTSAPIRVHDQVVPAKSLHHIIGGFLCLDTVWSPPLGDTLRGHLEGLVEGEQIDLGCIARDGWFYRSQDSFELMPHKRAATAFLFEFLAQIQEIGTAPMLDVRAYGRQLHAD